MSGFALRCQHPVTEAVNSANDTTCPKAASRYTEDLQDVHYLCDEHCSEALEWNDFRHEAVS